MQQAGSGQGIGTGGRLASIDVLRGAVMVLMALDHARDYWAPLHAPENLASHGSAAWFLTRWVTHFCAPVFVLLAGTSAAVRLRRRGDRGEMSWFLLTRGAWLIVLEFALISAIWQMRFPPPMLLAQVIWVIGVSMIVLAALIWLPRIAVGALAVIVIAGHNLLDGWDVPGAFVQPNAGMSVWEQIRLVLHTGWGAIPLTDNLAWMNVYPILPWVGVMALGYAIEPVFTLGERARRRVLIGVGLAATAAFIAVRAANGYGNFYPPAFTPWVQSGRWSEQSSAVLTVCSFLNCHKYPPSLAYLLMTLGPSLVALGLLDGVRWRAVRPLLVFGRVPLFFYVLHLPVLILSAGVWAYARFGEDAMRWGLTNPPPPEYTPGLWIAYIAWAGVVVALYPLCEWFARVKATRQDWWLSYL